MPNRFLYAPSPSQDNNIGDRNKRCYLYKAVPVASEYDDVGSPLVSTFKASFFGKLTDEYQGEITADVGVSSKGNWELYIRTRDDVQTRDRIRIGKMWFDVVNLQYLLDNQQYMVLGLRVSGEEDIYSASL